MIQVIITIADDPKDGQTGVSVRRRGEPASISEAHLSVVLSQEILGAIERTSQKLMNTGAISGTTVFEGESLKREGDAFERRIRG